MSAREEAVTAAVDALMQHRQQMLRGPLVECECGQTFDRFGEQMGHGVGAAIDAARPILLAESLAEIERLRNVHPVGPGRHEVDVNAWRQQHLTVVAERDALAAKVEAVRALAASRARSCNHLLSSLDRDQGHANCGSCASWVSDIRRALGDTP